MATKPDTFNKMSRYVLSVLGVTKTNMDVETLSGLTGGNLARDFFI